MINRVVIAKCARKQLDKVPTHIEQKLYGWAEAVNRDGLDQVRKVPGYHDEVLRGERSGQRSIRLSLAHRAIYVIKRDAVEFVSVEEVHKHKH
jgi:proteic killer suppression protein